MVFAEDFAGFTLDHGDVVGIDEDGHSLALCGGADAEMVPAAGVAQAILPCRSTWSLRTR
jgi:hypothetical protein